MKFGHFCLPSYVPVSDGPQRDYMTRLVDFLVESEARGFDSVWANEHHFHPFGGLLPSPPIMLAAVAQRTKRVRLGTSVICVPLHNPIEIAEQLAMVDLMSGGRVDFGFGRGFVLHDYDVLGIPSADAQARLFDAIEVILKAWSGRPFTHAGSHYNFPIETEVWPQPLQEPTPPLWMAATGDPTSFAYAGVQGYNLLTVAWVKPLPQLANLIETYRSSLRGDGTQIGVHYQVVVAEDGPEARRLMGEALQTYAVSQASARTKGQANARVHAGAGPNEGPPDVPRLIADGRILAGTPDEVAWQLEQARDLLGMTIVDCNFYFGGMPFNAAQRSLRLFGDHVIPRLRPEPRDQGPGVATA
jgi:alkanesulfonate monooxygenase SsuD/methylene tetrahydromethanopterin reductase-like flavin-dependent oxidoreductase (luciferase family)